MKDTRQKIYYFCDESSQVKERYMSVGGLAINSNSHDAVVERLISLRRRLKISREIKWCNVKERRDNCHREYANLLRELCEEGRVHFHIRFHKMSDWDHRLSGPRNKIDTVSKAFYQLVLHRPARFYGDVADIHVRPDQGECTARLQDFRGNLNTDTRKRYAITDCVRSIDYRDSKECLPLQLLDVTLGGFSALKNERELGKAKRRLADHIHGLWGRYDLSRSHPRGNLSFNVWNAYPGK